MHHTLVCLGLNHFIHSLPAGSNREVIANNRSKVYKYRGLAIRALSENVARETTRSNDLTISSILMFMAMEVSEALMGTGWFQKLTLATRFKIRALETGAHMRTA